MRIQTQQCKQAGGVFLIVMATAGVLSVICLGSYLSMASTEHRAVMRSLGWNTAMPLAEAGVEEALSHITVNQNNFAADGWALQGTNRYAKQRSLGAGYYSTSVSGSAGSLVTIRSTGYAQWDGTNHISRTVEVVAQSGSSIPRAVGLVAKNGIVFKGDLTVDSYNSTNSLYSTNGRFDPAKASDHATVQTPLGFTLGGNSSVYGSVACGAGGFITSGGNAKVGDKAWVNGKNKGIQPGHSTNSFDAAIPDVVAPYTSAAAPASGTVSGTSYNYVLNGGKYMASDLNAGGGSTTMVVTAPSTLVVSGDITLSKIVFAPGATLDLYIAAPSVTFCPAIAGMTESEAVTPIQFRVWGLPSCTSMDMTAGDSFAGMIYAPQAELRARGHASFYGSFTSSVFNCNGTFDLHYDEATYSYTPGGTSYQVVSWAEK